MEQKTTTKQKPQAIELFVFHVQTSILNCRKIMDHLNNHYGVSPEDVNWGHVGSAEHVSELLKEICEFVNLKAEGR